MARELVERKPVLPADLIRRGLVFEKPLLKTQLPWVRERGLPKSLPAAHKFEILEVPDPKLEGMVRLVVAQHGHGEEARHVIMGVAAEGARPDDPQYAYHPFTSRPFARDMRALLEKEEKFKQLASQAKGERRSPRRFIFFGIHLPPSSVHGELLNRKLISAKPTRVPPRVPSKIRWKEFRVMRLEVPGIQNNVPVVVATYLDGKGRSHQAAIGVAKVGNRITASADCVPHHLFVDENLFKTVQRLIYSLKRPK